MTEYEMLKSLEGKTVKEVTVIKSGGLVQLIIDTIDGERVRVTPEVWHPFGKAILTVDK